MKRFLILSFVCWFLVSMFTFAIGPLPANADDSRQNYYPIVLVHGLGGFDELLGIPYWGGAYDISEDLNSRDYPNFVAKIGPFSSNYDRACELYAQIKGGTVDYGQAHSEQYGHDRYGRTYPGFYPEWGELDESGELINKVHLVGHSMGGQTVRALVQLLGQGSAEEREVTPPEELSPLFDDQQKSWVSGVLTVATPHDGSSAAYALLGKGENSLLQQMIIFIGAVGGTAGLNVYDFYLDQWGLKRQSGESINQYTERVKNSNAWQTSRDLSNWDLKPEGAAELNSWVEAQPDVYYFSQAASCSYKSALTGKYLPRIEMNPLFWLFSSHIGAYTQSGPVPIDKSWWENDGLVSVVTAAGPTVDSSDEIVSYNGTPEIGKWNYLGVLKKVDHTSVVGILSLKDQRPLFRTYAELLASLPE